MREKTSFYLFFFGLRLEKKCHLFNFQKLALLKTPPLSLVNITVFFIHFYSP